MNRTSNIFKLMTAWTALAVLAAPALAAAACRRTEPGKEAASLPPAGEEVEAEAAETTPWLEVASGRGAFRLRVPDGWRIYAAKDRDWVTAATVEDMRVRTGVPAEVDRETMPLGDSAYRFSVYASANPYRQPPLARVTRKGFGPVDGVMGLRYTEDYRGAAARESAWFVPGERAYYFVFHRGRAYHYAVYRVLPGDPNRILTVERCVMTLKFGGDAVEK